MEKLFSSGAGVGEDLMGILNFMIMGLSQSMGNKMVIANIKER